MFRVPSVLSSLSIIRFLVRMRKNHTIPTLETLLLQAHVNWFFILGEKWIENSSEELEMKQSLTMVCIDYLGHDVPFWNRTSNVYLKFENLEIRKT